MKLSPILFPANVFVFAILEIVVHYAVPIAQVFASPWRWTGVLLIGLGIWIALEAKRLFRRYRTSVEPDKMPSALVTEGPFRFSRHPMYLGMTLGLTGEAVLLGSVTPFLAPLAFFLMVDTIYAVAEERTLDEVFGDEYSDYRRHVRKWL